MIHLSKCSLHTWKRELCWYCAKCSINVHSVKLVDGIIPLHPWWISRYLFYHVSWERYRTLQPQSTTPIYYWVLIKKQTWFCFMYFKALLLGAKLFRIVTPFWWMYCFILTEGPSNFWQYSLLWNSLLRGRGLPMRTARSVLNAYTREMSKSKGLGVQESSVVWRWS